MTPGANKVKLFAVEAAYPCGRIAETEFNLAHVVNTLAFQSS
jgi:hypothetical protein